MPRPVAILADAYPVASETFVAGEAAALAALGHAVRVEAALAADPPGEAAEGVPVAYGMRDGALRRAAALAWLVLRHPRGCLGDLRARERWRRDEEPRTLRELAPVALRVHRAGTTHLHAHFAAGAALDALRLHRLLRIPYSVTAHAFDIYARPRNLREKLERAAFATSGCAYTVRDLRDLAPAADVLEVVMGVDPGRFRRSRPLPGGRTVVAVGRLVSKKGFADLIEAAALLGDQVGAVRIAGEGPERAALERAIARHGLEGRVHLLGALAPDRVRDELERADVLAAPCVVAADGDRDSMPVVVKEAMAMELLVVASDEVGLPEIVAPPFGRLHPPGDPAALAAALREALALIPAEREEAGRAARAAVIEKAGLHAETAKLSALIERGS